MALREFKLPDPGEGLTEAEIVTWHVGPGDVVKVNDVVVEIETAKSLVELPVPFAGTVGALLVSEGDTVEVGTPILSVDDGADAGAPAPAPAAEPEPAAAGGDAGENGSGGSMGGRTAVLVGYGVKQTEATRRPRKQPATPGHQSAKASPPAPPDGHQSTRASTAERGSCRPVSASGRWRSRRCASSPRTSASTWRR